MEADTFSASRTARTVLRMAATASLATLDASGLPFVSLVTVATNPDGAPILLLSDLAVHTKNLKRDPHAALLLVASGGEAGDPLAGARLTIRGAIDGPVADGVARRRFIAHHEEAAGYADFADFGFYRVAVESGHLVAGFGRIVDLTAAKLLTDCADADELLASEEGAVAHMNADHRDALRLYATRLLGEADGDWRMTGADPDGIDLRAGAQRARLEFETPVKTAAELRRALVDLAAKATPSG